MGCCNGIKMMILEKRDGTQEDVGGDKLRQRDKKEVITVYKGLTL